ncbi:hypothetical protein pEaSNUABM50_00133 [Erwinia phage pEa_SNUABM_50]|uniref:Uncharacterized protein n=4 Tax=Eneladusvirus BF TaxID=2560751 RepID=A0A7L8ZN12_9CAUD|nr:hypothetical protein FDH34_gp135 [Serratia phage BF]QOI71073.1 hypothetical protein pEaSNUABM12_00135 [Erwinia phage pEa_SNUABM_12]QOI71618.1 hypothetical protein pEaSNUABM47_00134 [Erwinia phage pEa_SNUABM_47]QOI72157.1 hypothetical protein pEaSNUABM50_00133 [Erwinia phage pEa_SNUABM_50]QXO11283.1 hypothetical protein pEaSNUABM19_00137 [Erwinia phage pEa_SNUABM_19]QXO11831.1 hypothetical protein pEaSNUABM44_00135 [Erwinia phage pEa_SNUABM_44]QXO12383.1 hypothetical protein pEaSNUABM49_001
MIQYVITEGIHTGTIFSIIMSRSVVLKSDTIPVGTLLSNIPDDERMKMRFRVYDPN